jgi:hypothetical protein
MFLQESLKAKKTEKRNYGGDGSTEKLVKSLLLVMISGIFMLKSVFYWLLWLLLLLNA